MTRSIFDCPKKTDVFQCAKKTDTFIDQVDDIFIVVESSLSLIAHQTDTKISSYSFISIAHSTVCASRWLPSFTIVLSGGLWDKDAQGKPLMTWFEKAMFIILLVKNILSPFTYLHKIKEIDLGRHAHWMSIVINSILLVVSVATFIKNGYEWREYSKTSNWEKRYEELQSQHCCDEDTIIIQMAEEMRNKRDATGSAFLDIFENTASFFPPTEHFAIASPALCLIAASVRLLRITS